MSIPLLFGQPYVHTPLTLSGNEITDGTRGAALAGDGLSEDSSYGIWEASTNLCTNGGFETNTTGWTAWGAEASISRVTTQSKFGSASLEVVVTDLGSRGTRVKASLSATTVYTFSAWFKMPTGATVRLAVYDTPATTQLGAGVNVVGNDDWQRASATFTSDGDGGEHNFYIMTYADYNAVTFYVDGVQIEAQPIATPYIETDGGTAARSAARVQAPASLLDETQGWVAYRARMGWANTVDPSGNPVLLDWKDDANNLIQVRFDTTGNTWELQRRDTGNTGEATKADTFALSDVVTVIAAWDAANLKISVDGSVFTSAAATNIPVLAASTFDIGSIAGTSEHIDSDILWFACGTGTLTDADAALFYAWGNSDPQWHWFPKSAVITGLWHARSPMMKIRRGL